jgi:glucokinase
MRTRLAKMFAISEDAITFINDADAFLLGEIISERGAEVHRTVGVTLGTGIGSAFAKGKTILEFGRGIPPNGEIYNLYWKGRTVEHYLSAHAIVRSYREAGGHAETVAAIAGRARQEPLAEDVMRKFGETLGQALDEILVEFQPEVMILGGAIAKSGDLFLPALEHALSRIRPVIRLSTLFDAAALLGAAEHWSLLQGAHQ